MWPAMNAPRHSFSKGRTAQATGFGHGAPSSLSAQWTAVMDAAEIVAMLAGAESGNGTPEIRNFPARLQKEGDGWRQEQAMHGIADIKAVMEPGMSALLAINARGGNPTVAAKALWREFSAARSALVGLLPPSGQMGPRRSA